MLRRRLVNLCCAGGNEPSGERENPGGAETTLKTMPSNVNLHVNFILFIIYPVDYTFFCKKVSHASSTRLS